MDEVTKITLKTMQEDISEIKTYLIGEGDRVGLVIEVDRLKRSRAITNGIMWTVFTALIGVAATTIGATFLLR